MRLSIGTLLCTLLLLGSLSAQTLPEEIAKARQIQLLEWTSDDVVKHLGNTSPFMYGADVFPLEASQIHVRYSSGTCTQEEAFGVDSDDWKVESGVAVVVKIIPRAHLKVRDLDLGGVSLKKKLLYRGLDTYHIYYNKRAGVAVTTHVDVVDSILLFPPESSYPRLCDDKKIRAYYAKTEWKRDPEPEYACILRNMYANVEEVELTLSGAELYAVRTIARDPENDVLTYNYKVSAGKITGNGANVVWDLSGAQPGEHSIIVGVDDGVGVVGKTVTKTVVVK